MTDRHDKAEFDQRGHPSLERGEYVVRTEGKNRIVFDDRPYFCGDFCTNTGCGKARGSCECASPSWAARPDDYRWTRCGAHSLGGTDEVLVIESGNPDCTDLECDQSGTSHDHPSGFPDDPTVDGVNPLTPVTGYPIHVQGIAKCLDDDVKQWLRDGKFAQDGKQHAPLQEEDAPTVVSSRVRGVSSVPAPPGGIPMPIPMSVSVTFDSDMNPTTIDANSFTLRTASGVGVNGTVNYDPATRTARFLSNDPLDPASQYTATITTAVENRHGKALQADHSWTFSASPAVVETSPANGATDVSEKSTVSVVFHGENPTTIDGTSFALQTASGHDVNGALNYDPLTHTAIFRPDPPLTTDSQYTATITDAVKNSQNQPLRPQYSWTFSTAGAQASLSHDEALAQKCQGVYDDFDGVPCKYKSHVVRRDLTHGSLEEHIEGDRYTTIEGSWFGMAKGHLWNTFHSKVHSDYADDFSEVFRARKTEVQEGPLVEITRDTCKEYYYGDVWNEYGTSARPIRMTDHCHGEKTETYHEGWQKEFYLLAHHTTCHVAGVSEFNTFSSEVNGVGVSVNGLAVAVAAILAFSYATVAVNIDLIANISLGAAHIDIGALDLNVHAFELRKTEAGVKITKAEIWT